jgi:hypothetical protein
MGQVLQGSATTTHAVRAAIQRSKATTAELSAQFGVNAKTIIKWRNRSSVEDLPMGSKQVHSTVLTIAEEALCIAFRKHTLLPLDDCLYGTVNLASVRYIDVDNERLSCSCGRQVPRSHCLVPELAKRFAAKAVCV